MSLKIIGAGFPRTGTTTLKKALEVLGYDKTYHFKDLIANPKKLKHWQELENDGQTDFAQLFNGFAATVDFPGYPYYKILMKEYPNAKVILTKRNFEGWYESMSKTIWKSKQKTIFEKIILRIKMIFNERLRDVFKCIKFMRKTYLGKQFNNAFDSKSKAEKIFFAHIDEVTRHVPKKQLLIYEVADGWQPLCDFLGVQIPDESFPHLNKKENFRKMVKTMIKNATQSSGNNNYYKDGVLE